jgi:hypothetical protein
MRRLVCACLKSLLFFKAFASSYEEHEDLWVVSTVYRFTDEDMRVCLAAPEKPAESGYKRNEVAPRSVDGIPFFLVFEGYTWGHHICEQSTGNESRSEDIESVYVHKALIARPI